MGVFERPDSPYFWIYLEPARAKERTDVPRQPGNRELAERVYQQRMKTLVKSRLSHQRYRLLSNQDSFHSRAGWCYIYFISNGELVKIGRAIDVLKRLQSMQTSSAEPLTVLATFIGNVELEHLIHRRFASDRLKGEWFNATPDLMRFIKRRQAGIDPMAELANHFRSVHAIKRKPI
jgi:Meiotically Up-regulated Gene 113 (MUG113) protein